MTLLRALRFPAALALALVLATAPSCDRSSVAPQPTAPQPAPSQASTLPSAPAAQPAPLDHIEVMTGGATPDQRVPMVVAIHGLGDRPEHFRSVLPSLDVPARLIFPRGFSPWHGGHSWFEFDRKDLEGLGDRISASADRVAAGIEALARSRPTAGRPIVTGFSQGGMLSFAIAVRHPSAVSAAFPMGGMLPRSARPASAPEGAPPIFAWHGADDRLVPVQLARDTVAHLRGLGLRAELEELPGIGHTIPTSMRAALRERVTAAVRASAQ